MKPPVVLPPELGVIADDLFRELDRAAVPELAELLDDLTAHDPDVLAAVADIDRSLIWSLLELTPLERLARCSENARGIASLVEARRRRVS
jgi:hypothetical protein